MERCEGRWLRFDLEYAQTVVLDKDEAKLATAEILQQHCIARDRSPDLVRGAEGEEEVEAGKREGKKKGKRGGGGGAKGGQRACQAGAHADGVSLNRLVYLWKPKEH